MQCSLIKIFYFQHTAEPTQRIANHIRHRDGVRAVLDGEASPACTQIFGFGHEFAVAEARCGHRNRRRSPCSDYVLQQWATTG